VDSSDLDCLLVHDSLDQQESAPQTFVTPVPQKLYHVLSTTCLHMNLKAHMACYFNRVNETEGVLKVTDGHVHTLYMF